MKICIISREYPPHGLQWGSGWLYQKLARQYVLRGHEVHVVCQAAGKPCVRLDEGVVVHEVGDRPGRGSIFARVDWMLHAWLKLRQLVLKYHIDIVDAQFMWAEGLVHCISKSDVPLVLMSHGWMDMLLETHSYTSKREFLQLKLVSFLETFVARRSSKVMASSKFTVSKLVSRVRIPQSKISLIYEHVETEKIQKGKPSLVRNQLGIGEDPWVLCAGYLQARKGIKTLSDAIPKVIQQLPKTKFIFIGKDTYTAPKGGSFKAYLQTKAEKQGFEKNLILLNFVSDSFRWHLFSTCDVFVFPSLYEPFGKPVLEAMFCQRPVVATSTGIAAELVNVSKALLVVPTANAEALSQAIVTLLSLPREQRERLAVNHSRIIQKGFSFDQVVRKTLAVYEEAIKCSKSVIS